MSKIALTGNASGTGVFTIASPNTNTDRTLTLPDEAGTIDTLQRAGNVLQVVNVVYATVTSSSSSTYADTGLSANITPTSSSSKILVLVNQGGCGKQTNNTRIRLKLLRGATDIQTIDPGVGGFTNSTATNFIGSISLAYLDFPATTSSTTYKTQFASHNSSATVYVQTDGAASSITLMEIAA